MDKHLLHLYWNAKHNKDLELQFTILKEYIKSANCCNIEMAELLQICSTLGISKLCQKISNFLKQQKQAEKRLS